jgi:hypothetical protein
LVTVDRFRVQGSGFKVQGSRFKIQGSGFKVKNKEGIRMFLQLPNGFCPRISRN